ncbi:NAD(P)H-binding protein [Vibrio sp. Of7-15]|uniref:NAD(P)H-binding protein n=1 Tax=Vibrio sp. Of7-15 TaxID=2724879 RepID=UPI001EF2C047|nr:NAD(P)H-binding protein [Vibrio sp. Of7-15]MCG7495846.1 NAD(P)H-binding protein [Vibrio sp. Of7-15]
MLNSKQQTHKSITIIAGASGLIGSEVLESLLKSDDIDTIHCLVRKSLPLHSNKLQQHIDLNLRITNWNEEQHIPETGYICLGTTLEQAGSKQALKDIDVDLVCQVAHTMKVLGVKRIAVVSSLFAHPWSPSHYLRCKGKMEKLLTQIGFDQVVFTRPGPLLGERAIPRKNEVVTATMLSLFQPFLVGPLANIKPIQAQKVAQAMVHSLNAPFHSDSSKTVILSSRRMEEIAQ